MAEGKDQELKKQSREWTSGEEEVEGIGEKLCFGGEKKRKRETKAEERELLRQDPLVLFGSDIMMMILSHLDARSVALSLAVSRGWRGVASSDRLWSSKCEELWLSKAHIPRSSQLRGLSKLAAYSLSIMDGKRGRITKDDLCDHVWEFHFTQAAPAYRRNLDPHRGGAGPPKRHYFDTDGIQAADPGDMVWGGRKACYSIVTTLAGEGQIREHYVRINRLPRMYVSRKADWSWEMSNHLYCYTSVPDADKKGGTGPLFPVF